MRPDLNVLHLSQKMGVGGLERVIIELATAQLAARDVHPHVYAYDEASLDTGYLPELRRLGIPCAAQPKPPGFSVTTVAEIHAYCRKHDISVIHSHDLNALLYASFVKMRAWGTIKVVHTQHSFLHIASRKQALFEHVFPKFADRIVCPAPSLVRTYERFGSFADRMRVIPNPVRWSSTAPSTPEPAYLERIPPNVKRLLVLGRVHPGKGQSRVLDLWPKLSDSFRREYAVVFIGPSTDAVYRAELEAHAAKLPDASHLVWLDRTDRPLAWMRACDVFVSLSDVEGMPLAPLEAFGVGAKLVLSDIDGHRDLELPTARLVATAPTDENARAFERAVVSASPATAAEIDLVHARHDTAAVARAYADAYREAVAP